MKTPLCGAGDLLLTFARLKQIPRAATQFPKVLTRVAAARGMTVFLMEISFGSNCAFRFRGILH